MSATLSIRFAMRGKQFGNVNPRHVGFDRGKEPANLRGCVGFRIPQIEMTGCAAIEDQDDGLRFARSRPGPRTRSRSRHQRAELIQAEAEQAKGPRLENIPACDSCAWGDRERGHTSNNPPPSLFKVFIR